MDNKQDQNVNFDELLASAQEDTRIDLGDSGTDNLDDFMQEKDEPKAFSPFTSETDNSFIPEEIPDGFSPFGTSDDDDKSNSEKDALPSFLTQQNEETEHTFAPDDEVMEFLPSVSAKSDIDDDFSENVETVDPIKDFSDFKLNDLDSALKSFQEARRGKSDKNKKEDEKADVVYDTSMPGEILAGVEEEIAEPRIEKHRPSMNPQTVDDRDVKLYGLSEESVDILKRYSGSLGDKTYELSRNNMPEFLDTDKTIRVIHISVASSYGWNVFFDNGIFMNLRDLQTYQMRHGKMPYNSGKIVYGNRTTQFENINRIVAYELPRYFSYKPE